MSLYSRYLPAVSVAVCAMALGVQTLILHPWHTRLDTEFKSLKSLKAEHDKHLEVYNRIRLERIDKLEKRIDKLVEKHEKILKI